jgi:hypothetical protein
MAVAGTVVAITFGREGAARLAKAPGWGPLGEIRAE